MRLRHQLAAFSPIRAASVAAALDSIYHRGAIADLEATLRETYRADQVALLDSGTHALQLALEVAMRSRGKEAIVAIPGFTCFDVATAVVGANARAVLYDIDPHTLTPDLDSLQRAVGQGATIAVIASLYGVPVPWGEVQQVAGDALLIEDAAQGHGSTWNGEPLGSFGDLSVLSFSRGKGWTGGYGGGLLSRGSVAAPAIPATGVDVKGIGVLAAQWVLGRPALYGVPRAIPGLNLGETIYHAPSRIRGMSESAAAALLFNRDAAAREAEARRANARRLSASMKRVNSIVPIPLASNARGGYLRLPFRLAGGFPRFGDPDRAMRLGLAPSYPVALEDLAALRASIRPSARTPGSAELARSLVTAPTHSLLSESDLVTIEKLLAALSERPDSSL
jgi:dTDP-4-amino-4,6-dideoxygalactose transaminase